MTTSLSTPLLETEPVRARAIGFSLGNNLLSFAGASIATCSHCFFRPRLGHRILWQRLHAVIVINRLRLGRRDHRPVGRAAH